MTGPELLARGIERFNAGDARAALKDFAASQTLQDGPEVRLFSAHACLALGETAAAAKVLIALADKFPRHVPARLVLADLLHRQGRLLEAAEQLRAALKAEPAHAEARRRLAELETGQSDGAPREKTRARRGASKKTAPLDARTFAAPVSGETVLSLPGGPLRVPRLGNLAVELVAMLAGVKPVTHVHARESDLPALEEIARRLKLALRAFARTAGGEARLQVLLGTSEKDLAQTARLWGREDVNPGPSLGYPACCARAYERHTDDRSGDDIVRAIARRTKSSGPLPFLLNDVFYFYSRALSIQDGARRQSLYAANPGLDLDLLNAIPWHPCSYLCAESRRKAERIWKTMKKTAPALAATLRETLARPVLFWDWDRFAVLTRRRGPSFSYAGVGAPKSLLDAAPAALLAEGDRLVRSGKSFAVVRGEKELGVLPGEPLLLDFSA